MEERKVKRLIWDVFSYYKSPQNIFPLSISHSLETIKIERESEI